MARALVVEWKGKESSFGLNKIDRSKVYGKKKRIAVDKNGKVCETASIDVNTGILLRTGMTAQGYFSSLGEWIPNSDLVGINEEGKAVDQVPSTLGIPQKAEYAKLDDLLDLCVNSAFALLPDELDERINSELENGAIFEVPFNYRTDYQCEKGFLFRNDHGCFLLVGQLLNTEWVSCDNKPVAETEMKTDDDLDFEMF